MFLFFDEPKHMLFQLRFQKSSPIDGVGSI